ncbi:hypothetical protein DYBT9275_03560 [Dyadobacter sp. CECT 9275]|uniref:L,D-TPase catalytic domain-containing protein n=1 Tax=Dyadobacter helix TaxID=2822344 RepID=A0A916JEU2_9BACT|nr:L,D-transpeptidase family protein [Dyadobacter sp. CECT 9275]CAG5005312.1 hypothetical protein DYBT9275_03560 [Dyadobacter sp. CECT 9275]
MKYLKKRRELRYIPLLILFSLAIVQSCKKDPKTMTNEQIAQELGSESKYKHLLDYVKSIGINEARFEKKEGSAPVFELLQEVAYGRKSNIRFVEKTLNPDSIRIREAAEELIKGQNVPKVMEKLEPSYPAYITLKAHYARLIRESKKDSARYVANALNAYRWMQRQVQGAPRFVMVNIQGAYLRGMDSLGNVAISMRTVVGKRDTPTPTMDTYATSIVTHPYWNVPKSIAMREILPKAKSNPDYLTNNKIEVIDKKGQAVDPSEIDWEAAAPENFPYRFRQETGEDNSLGLLKVEIKNPLAIYLHDTNARYLFGKDQRWRSHGCVRVQHPTELANFMAGDQLLENDFLTEQDTTATPPKWHKLQRRIPVFLFYLGADCNEKGQLLYFEDVYKRGAPKV